MATKVDKGERAVSPVIGVILMVAITVILAAVIGTFVLGLGQNVQSNVQAGASITYDGPDNAVSITFTSNQNAEYLKTAVTDQGSSESNTVYMCAVGAQVELSDGDATANGATVSTSGSTGSNTDCSTAIASPLGSDFVEDGRSIKVVVTAVKGEQSTVVNQDTGTV